MTTRDAALLDALRQQQKVIEALAHGHGLTAEVHLRGVRAAIDRLEATVQSSEPGGGR